LIPDAGSVFDYTLDVERPGNWVKWADQVSPAAGATIGGGRRGGGAAASEFDHADSSEHMIVPTAETVKQAFFLELSVAQQRPLAMVGHTGTGECSLMLAGFSSLLKLATFSSNGEAIMAFKASLVSILAVQENPS